MPTRPLRPCASQPRCRALTTERYCAACQESGQTKEREHDRRRGSSNDRGYTSRWRRYARQFLNENPLCHYCSLQGRTVASQCVDHATPPSRGGDFWDADQHRAACLPCNSAKGNRTEGEYLAVLGTPRSRVPLTIVCGPPGSGKSTWVKERATANDVVIDLDEIMARIARLPLYKAGRNLLGTALDQRQRMLNALADDRTHTHAYFIVGAPTVGERAMWRDTLKPEHIVVLTTPAEVCESRIRADSRRDTQTQEEHIAAARAWWRRYQPAPFDRSLAA